MTPEERAMEAVENQLLSYLETKQELADALALIIREVIAEEREACARLVEAYGTVDTPEYATVDPDSAILLAGVIRARA